MPRDRFFWNRWTRRLDMIATVAGLIAITAAVISGSTILIIIAAVVNAIAWFTSILHRRAEKQAFDA